MSHFSSRNICLSACIKEVTSGLPLLSSANVPERSLFVYLISVKEKVRGGTLNGREMSFSRSESVHFELFSLAHADLFEKLTNIGALITLKLNYFSVFLVFDHRSITGEFLLQCANEKFLIELLSDALSTGDHRISVLVSEGERDLLARWSRSSCHCVVEYEYE